MSNSVIIEEIFDASAERVWQAITDKNKMKKWYFDLDEFNPVVGFNFKFPGKGHNGDDYMHLCRVTEVIPNKKLQYSWSYENLSGVSYVTFELFSEGEKTRLKLTHSGLDSFPKNNPDFAMESFKGGWTKILSESLKNFINNN